MSNFKSTKAFGFNFFNFFNFSNFSNFFNFPVCESLYITSR